MRRVIYLDPQELTFEEWLFSYFVPYNINTIIGQGDYFLLGSLQSCNIIG